MFNQQQKKKTICHILLLEQFLFATNAPGSIHFFMLNKNSATVCESEMFYILKLIIVLACFAFSLCVHFWMSCPKRIRLFCEDLCCVFLVMHFELCIFECIAHYRMLLDIFKDIFQYFNFISL